MRMPNRLTEDTVMDEIRQLIDEARNLPADSQVYERGDIRMSHQPRTKMLIERVFVQRYGKLYRSSFDGKRWRAIEEVGGSI
jgi:hypothetical protein